MLRALSVNAPVGHLLWRYQRMTLIIFLVIFAGIALNLKFFQVSMYNPLHAATFLECLFGIIIHCNPISVKLV